MLRPTMSILALFAALFLIAACESEEPTSPYVGYLEEEIPPCTPVEGSSVDPCEPGLPWVYVSHLILGSEPYGMRFLLEPLSPDPVWVTSIVLRGTFLPGTVRCDADGKRFRPPPYDNEDLALLETYRSIKCYADVRVNAYVLGSGPPTLTVMVWNDLYWFTFDQESVEPLRSSLERVLTEGGELNLNISVPAGGIEGRERILFIGSPVDVSSEAWEVFETWGVERQEDGTVIAVHRDRDAWKHYTDDYYTYRSRLEMELPAFTQAVTTANQERIIEYEGRIGADEDLPDLITDANQLSQFYRDTGAYNHPDGPPPQPPPPCGLVVPNQADNPGLMPDCFALLAAKDTLRGTATLNWGLDTSITSWDGVTVEGTPKRVTKLLLSNKSLTGSIPKELGQLTGLTHLDLSRNSLTGEIPSELGELSGLVELKLSGNRLEVCIPLALKDVATNDLSSLNLLYCPPAPTDVTVGTPGEQSVALTWGAVSNTVAYRVEYRSLFLGDWTVDDDTLTVTSHIVDGLNCGTSYQFRVSAYGNGTTYAASWSEPSAVAPLYLEPSDGPMGTTGACPEFSPTPTASGRTNTISRAVERAGFAPAAPGAAR